MARHRAQDACLLETVPRPQGRGGHWQARVPTFHPRLASGAQFIGMGVACYSVLRPYIIGVASMLCKQDAEELFELVRKDAQSWLAQARRLRLSANVILPEWEEIRRHPQSMPGIRDKMLAYSESFMLLTGFAFENLLKGILYGRDTNNKVARSKNGHGIVQMANAAATLIGDESNLLERLETYLVWAGRYQLPMTPDAFYKSQDSVSIVVEDPAVIDRLFEKLEQILQSEWRARENSRSA